MNDKQVYNGKDIDFNKSPSDDYKTYGSFDCIAQDVLKLQNSLSEISQNNYDFNGGKCKKT